MNHTHCEKPNYILDFLKLYNELGKVKFFQISIIGFIGVIIEVFPYRRGEGSTDSVKKQNAKSLRLSD